jgi:adenosylcobinamide-phosphate synthase
MADALLALPLALLIDRVVGDPAILWRRIGHPTAWVGEAIDRLDGMLNRAQLPPIARRRNGVIAILAIGAAGALAGWMISAALAGLRFGFAIEAVLASIFIAQKSLVDHVLDVARHLDRGPAAGRSAVAKIVGRDVTALDQPGVARAAVESAAESFSDGVVAPAFCYLLLGLPGLIVFKIVNTADSMVGHRTPRHEAFGWAAARCDDLLNLLPARLAALLIALGGAARGRPGAFALRIARRDAALHDSPNAGWPEAAMAGALGLALGGPRRYGGEIHDGAWLNREGRPAATVADIRAAVRIIDAAWMALLLVTMAIAFIALWFGR